MITSEQHLSLTEIKAAIELFDDALGKVLENIDDPNTGEQSRRINLEFTIVPDRVSGMHVVKVGVKTKLADNREWEGRFVCGRERGKMVARMLNAYQQQELPLNVAEFKREEV